MLVAQGACPTCGAPVSFAIGTSVSQVCKYCRSVVVRTDRDLQSLGRVADLVPTVAPIAVDDEGSILGRPMRIFGRVQLDHGAGPWDEWYVGYRDGTWGWLAYAQGNWYVTSEVALPEMPRPWVEHQVGRDVSFGAHAAFRVKERKEATLVSAEGELPQTLQAGQARFYVDLVGANDGFATLDFGDGKTPPRFYVGHQVPEGAVQVRARGERPVQEIETTSVTCPSCGGNVPAQAPRRAERFGCPYCGAVSDIPARRVIEQQERARAQPDIPLGSRGTFGGDAFVVCGFLERSTRAEDELFSWQEYLLWSPTVGFRWLVKDESTWQWITPLNVAEIDLRALPRQVTWRGRTFRVRNDNAARVEYVLGEFYWKVQVGETVRSQDFLAGRDVIAGETSDDETNWSLATPIPWSTVATTFSLPANSPGSHFSAPGGTAASPNTATVIVVLVILVIVAMVLFDSCSSCGSPGGGIFFGGGSTSGGSRGGK